ncbi:tetratricopeptide repeat-containing sensor histidine kinase [uncultured Croceitalea sp.]|uniref:ATP-binding protein n=1 Tax=uncultured Croceitalea sp. TaxID=1798908 RepID=UPI0033064767
MNNLFNNSFSFWSFRLKHISIPRICLLLFFLTNNLVIAQQLEGKKLELLLQKKHKTIETFSLLGDHYLTQNLTKAFEYASKALALSKKEKNEIEEINSYLRLGRVFFEQGYIEKAEENFKIAYNLSQRENRKNDIIKSLIQLSKTYNFIGKEELALDFLNHGILLEKSSPNIKLRGYLLLELSKSYSRLRDKVKALEYILKAETLIPQIDLEVYASEVYLVLGDIYRFTDKSKEGIKYLSEAKLKAKSNQLLLFYINERLGVAYNELLIPWIADSTGVNDPSWFKNAKNHLSRAIEVSEKLHSESKKAIATTSLGNVYLYEGELEKARKYYLDALTIHEKYNNHLFLSQTYNAIGGYFYFKGDKKGAIPYALKAYELAVQISSKHGIRQSSGNLSELYEDGMGDYKNALKYHKVRLNYNDSIYNEEKAKRIIEFQTAFETSKKDQELVEKEQKINQQRLRLFLLVFGIVILLSLVFIFYRNWLFQKRANREIESLNESIQKQNNSIKVKNTKIRAQHLRLQNLYKSKDQLLKIISHDIRSPVANFKMYADLLRHYRELGNMEEVIKLEDELDESAIQLNNLTSRLLDWLFVQDEKLKLKEISLNEVFRQVYDSNKSISKLKGIDFKVQDYPYDFRVRTNKNALFVICNNLVNNALKFSKPGQEVILKSEVFKEKVLIKVVDEGAGMGEECLKKLFSMNKHRSSLGTNGEKGQGIGLFLVQELAQKIKADLKIKSVLEKGTEITLTL